MTAIEFVQARNQTVAADVPRVAAWGGRPRTIESITIHHWGSTGQTHDGVVAWFRDAAPTSAHSVVSAGRITQMVLDEDAAWHAGNAVGNTSSIGIECRPEAADADYQTVAELIRTLRTRHGDLPLIPHSHWTSTECPGRWDLARLDHEARIASTQKGTTMAYKSLVTPNYNAVANAGWCLSFAQAFYGAPVAYANAWEAWENVPASFKHAGQYPPEDAQSVLWFSHTGTYWDSALGDFRYGEWGHVVGYVPGRGIYSAPAVQQTDSAGTYIPSQGVYSNIPQIEAAYNCRYVGWSESLNGLRVCAPVAAATAALTVPGDTSKQRTTGTAGAKRRTGPGTTFPENGTALAGGVTGNFVGYARGENIQGNAIWLKGISGDWFWSGGFTSTSTAGLKDLTPKAITKVFTMKDVPGGVLARSKPTTAGEVLSTFKPNPKGNGKNKATVTAWTKGETVNGTNVWYRLHAVKGGGYQWMHASTFTNATTTGLPEVKA